MHYLIITLTIGVLMFAGSASSVSAASLSSSSSTLNWKSVVTKANPYVTVNNKIVTIDPQISQHLSADEVALVKQYVNHSDVLI